MENSLNNTQSAPDTANPQDATQSDGTNNASDFQPAAEADALNSEAKDLTVQETGDPLQASSAAKESGNFMAWGLIAVVAVVAIVWFVKLLIEDSEPERSPARASVASKSSKPVNTAKTKKSASKKSASKSRVKKSSKKRR